MTVSRYRHIILALSATLLLVVAACSESDSETPDAEAILNNATEAFEETESAAFELDIGGVIGIDDDGMLQLGAVTGEVVRPASARADASVQFGGTSVTMEMIASDGEMFIRNLLTGNWERAPVDLQYDPARIFDEEDGISAIIAQLEDLELQGEDSVGGTDTYHLTANVDTAHVRELAGNFFVADTLGIEIWVATDDYRLMRVELHDTGAEDATSWELSLSNHNDKVEITPPDIS